jgi:uncharacterized protein
MDREEALALSGVVVVLILMVAGSGVEWGLPKGRTAVKEQYSRGPATGAGAGHARVVLLAVDGSGKGLTGEAIATVAPGSGRIMIDIGGSLPHTDVQESIRIAAKVASDVSGRSLEGVDVSYAFLSPAEVVEGPSAGASLAIATIAALENRTIREDVAITGSLEEDGSITGTSGIMEKARAAREANVSLMLMPLRLGSDAGAYIRQEGCSTEGGAEYCRTDYVPDIGRLSEEAGIMIAAVNNITDAMKYFFEPGTGLEGRA